MKIKNVKKIIGMTKSLTGAYGQFFVEVFLDMKTGKLHGNEMLRGNWTKYDSSEMIHVENFYNPTTMEEVKQAVVECLDRRERVWRERT